jgi:SAM-dependent methyltransferase
VPAKVLELACGNGRLLVELARRSLVERALGVDLARSRILFAREWAKDEAHEQLTFEVADVLRFELPPHAFSAALCITGAFGYFEPLESGAAERVARALHSTLAEDGFLCLELYPRLDARNLLGATGGEARVWTELPPSDPWRFYLSRLLVDASGQILTHEKTFIHRTSGEVDSGRLERLYLYTPEGIESLLLQVGFRSVEIFEGWSETPYSGGEQMVVTAFR